MEKKTSDILTNIYYNICPLNTICRYSLHETETYQNA